MIESHPRLAVPYAVLGDVLRSRGDHSGAATQYAYAYQMDPRNTMYAKRHEESIRKTSRDWSVEGGAAWALIGAFGVVLYLVMTHEPALLPGLPLFSTWTLSAVIGTLVAGLLVGALMSQASWLDRFEVATAATPGRPFPTVALALVAIVNFWVAAAIYVVIPHPRSPWQYSTSLVLSSTAGVTILLSFAVAKHGGTMDAWQLLAWGGNLVYIGAMFGWMIADSFRRN